MDKRTSRLTTRKLSKQKVKRHNQASHTLALQLLRDRAISHGQVMYQMTSEGLFASKKQGRRVFFQAHLPEAQRSTVESYIEANSMSVRVIDIYGDLPCVDFHSEEELGQIFEDFRDGWTRFRHTFPRSKGVLEISAPGFSHDGVQGMIHLGQTIDWLDGYGVCYLYECRDGVWTLVGELGTWVS